MVSLRRNTGMRIFVPAFHLAMAGSRPTGPASGLAYASLWRHARPRRALGYLLGSTVASTAFLREGDQPHLLLVPPVRPFPKESLKGTALSLDYRMSLYLIVAPRIRTHPSLDETLNGVSEYSTSKQEPAKSGWFSLNPTTSPAWLLEL